MGRTSIKNKLILSFLALLLLVIVIVGVVNRVTNDFLIAQAISIAIAMASGVLFGSLFSGSLVKRLNSLSDIAKEVSRGDLSKEIPLLSYDEVRDLEEVFAMMVNHLREILADGKRVAQQVQDTNTRLVTLTKGMLANSHRIDQSAKSIAEGSESQTLIVQRTSVRVDETLREMDMMFRKTTETVAKINEAQRRTESGEANARETLNHLEEVLKRMEEYAQPIYRLSKKVEKIQMVINVMDEIAQKTDLLSLNASIEATRAGELGRGFALVANEIRSMAENSKQSSQEIRHIVEGVLEDNQAVLESLGKSQNGITRGREIIHGIVGTFGETLSSVQEIFSQVRTVEELTRKEMEQLKELLVSFKDLSRLAHENFVSSQKTTLATKNQKEDMKKIVIAINSLESLSEKMVETQRRFDLGER